MRRQRLRSPYIDYFHGWFFITFQIVHNKSVLGAIVGEQCILNELGQAVHDAWLTEPDHVSGLEIFDFQVMPNHFHALLYYDGRGGWDVRGGSIVPSPTSAGLGGPAATRGDRATVPSSDRAIAPSGDRTAVPGRARLVISTCTSYYERQLLDQCLRTGRRFIWISPGGFSPAILEKTAAARTAGLALLLSPVPAGTGLNKQRANWCNQFIVKNVSEIWYGHIRIGGSLESILKGCGKRIF